MENNTWPFCKSTLATLASPLTTNLFWHWQHGLMFKQLQFLVILHNIPIHELGTKSPQTRLLGLDILPSFKSTSAAPLTPQPSPLTNNFFGIDNVDSFSKIIATSGHSTQNAYTGTWYKVLASPMLMLGSSSASNQHLLHLRHPGLPATSTYSSQA